MKERMPSTPWAAAAELSARGEPFVLATVVRAVAPTSAKPGDKAVLTASGDLIGWVGGSCAEPIVRQEARAALSDGECRLVHIAPGDILPQDRQGLTLHPMTCYSGGALEIHIEPQLPKPALVVFGTSPVARACLRQGELLGYRSLRVEKDPPSEATATVCGIDVVPQVAGPVYVVVATHGTFDGAALKKALSMAPDYLGFVVSPRRWGAERAKLLARGFTEAQVDRIRAPAGLDLGGRAPEEIALSIFAEIVQQRRRAEVAPGAHPGAVAFHDPSTPLEEAPDRAEPAGAAESTASRCH